MELIHSEVIDKRMGWPLGRAERLARQRRLPHVLLPDGAIRFDPIEIERLLVRVASTAIDQRGVSHVE